MVRIVKLGGFSLAPFAQIHVHAVGATISHTCNRAHTAMIAAGRRVDGLVFAASKGNDFGQKEQGPRNQTDINPFGGRSIIVIIVVVSIIIVVIIVVAIIFVIADIALGWITFNTCGHF